MKFAKNIETWIKHKSPNALRERFRSSKYMSIMRQSKPIELIVHVGAHYAEDIDFYEEVGAKTVLWIEADPDTYKVLQGVLDARSCSKTVHLSQCSLVSSSNNNAIPFYRFNGDGSSSSVHHSTDALRDRFKHVKETGEVIKLQTRTLASILIEHNIKIDKTNNPMLVVDVQGHELHVLNGSVSELKKFKFCKCEVSRVETYEEGAKFKEIDTFFKEKKFALVSHRYFRVPKHGDVLYQKSDTI